jgi:uncharacterized protein (TIGR02588 family)
MATRRTSAAAQAGKNALEWTVFAASVLLVLAMLVLLAREAAGWKHRPPELTLRLGGPEQRGNEMTLVVEVTNHGDVAAADVRVEIVSGTADSLHRAHLMFDFISRHETRRGHVALPAGGGPPRVAGVGFAEP